MTDVAAKPRTKREAKEALGPYGRGGKAINELDDRLGVAKGGRTFLDKIFPDHWSFMLGEIALYSFVILLGTGVFLTLYYVPSGHEIVYHGSYVPLQGQKVSEAYASTVGLSFDVRSGLLMRQAHHWAADIFLGAIAVRRVCRRAAGRRSGAAGGGHRRREPMAVCRRPGDPGDDFSLAAPTGADARSGGGVRRTRRRTARPGAGRRGAAGRDRRDRR